MRKAKQQHCLIGIGRKKCPEAQKQKPVAHHDVSTQRWHLVKQWVLREVHALRGFTAAAAAVCAVVGWCTQMVVITCVHVCTGRVLHVLLFCFSAR